MHKSLTHKKRDKRSLVRKDRKFKVGFLRETSDRDEGPVMLWDEQRKLREGC